MSSVPSCTIVYIPKLGDAWHKAGAAVKKKSKMRIAELFWMNSSDIPNSEAIPHWRSAANQPHSHYLWGQKIHRHFPVFKGHFCALKTFENTLFQTCFSMAGHGFRLKKTENGLFLLCESSCRACSKLAELPFATMSWNLWPWGLGNLGPGPGLHRKVFDFQKG